MITYNLTMTLPLASDVDRIAGMLEDAAAQVREMSSVRAAHSMELRSVFLPGNKDDLVICKHGVASIEYPPAPANTSDH